MEQLTRLDRRHVWHPFTQEQTAPDPIPIVSAKGATLYAEGGLPYLDLISSWWVSIHGHAHPVIARAVARQAERLEQVIFAGFTHEPAVRLASALAEELPAGLERVFFSDNGSTAVEVALKMARQYWRNRGRERDRFLAFDGGYHGDTVGAMSVGNSSGFFDAFQGLLFPVDTVPFPETWQGDEAVEQTEAKALAALDRYLEKQGGQCAAMILEPLVQGASGMRMCRPAFLCTLAERVRQSGILLIFDEVMTGFGRTGTLFACQKAGVTPDIICLSKGLTGGFLPMSVTVCHPEIYDAFLGESFDRAFAHGHSFTANPLGCAAGLASLALFKQEQTLQRVAVIEKIHQHRLQAVSEHPLVHRPRVMGAIAALEINVDDPGYHSRVAPLLKGFFLDRGLLIRPLGNVFYLLPPYCITKTELNRAWDGLEAALAWLDGQISVS